MVFCFLFYLFITVCLGEKKKHYKPHSIRNNNSYLITNKLK